MPCASTAAGRTVENARQAGARGGPSAVDERVASAGDRQGPAERLARAPAGVPDRRTRREQADDRPHGEPQMVSSPCGGDVRIESNLGSQGGCLLLFGLPFFGVGVMALAAMVASGQPMVGPMIVMAVFLAIGGAIVLYGARKLYQSRKFGPVFLDLAGSPRLGTELTGAVEARLALPPGSVALLHLQCRRDTHNGRSGKHSHWHTVVLHEEKRQVSPSEATSPSAGRLRIPVCLLLPGEAPPTGEGVSPTGHRTKVRWTLDCSADIAGVDFSASFPLSLPG